MKFGLKTIEMNFIVKNTGYPIKLMNTVIPISVNVHDRIYPKDVCTGYILSWLIPYPRAKFWSWVALTVVRSL
jgi:hypothetical protein